MTEPQALHLQAHPDNPPLEVARLAVSAAWCADGGLRLHYRIEAPAAALRLPAPVGGGSANGLWRHTCFEAFVAAAGEAAYREFNFSPDGRSAVYDFSDYRARCERRPRPAPLPLHVGAGGLSLAVDVPPQLLPAADELDCGLSAVVEGADGVVGYWALAHGPGRPDFHRRETFRCRLRRASAGRQR